MLYSFLIFFVSLALLAGGVFLLVVAAAVTNVLWRLLRHGPAAAQEAFEHGDSVWNWWNAKAPDGFSPHGLRARCSLAGRYDKDLGIVAVEERASNPKYIQ